MDEEIKKEFEKVWEKIREIENNPQTMTKTEDIENKNKLISLREFLNLHKFDSDLDKTLIILYYYEKFKRVKGITSKNITEGFKEIRESLPANIADKFQKLAKKGWIMPSNKSDKLNSWTYTNSGEKYIESITI